MGVQKKRKTDSTSKQETILAQQDILTSCANRTLPYHLYADAFGLLRFGAPSTSVRVSKNPQTVKMYFIIEKDSLFGSTKMRKTASTPKQKTILAQQDILTSCANRTLPYHLYADAFGLLRFGAPSTSVRLSKNAFSTV